LPHSKYLLAAAENIFFFCANAAVEMVVVVLDNFLLCEVDDFLMPASSSVTGDVSASAGAENIFFCSANAAVEMTAVVDFFLRDAPVVNFLLPASASVTDAVLFALVVLYVGDTASPLPLGRLIILNSSIVGGCG
jgi:hypothetical protein